MPATTRTMSVGSVWSSRHRLAIAVLGITYAILNATMFSARIGGQVHITAIENGDFDRAMN